MKKLFSILFALFLVGGLYAQDVKIELGPEMKLSKRKILLGHLHSNSDGHYMYFMESKGGISIGGVSLNPRNKFMLEKYDSKLQLDFSKEYLTNDKNIFGMEMNFFKNKFGWLQYKIDKKNDKLNYYIVPINLKGKPSKAKKIASFLYERRSDFPTVDWKISKDTTKILFIAESDRDRKKEDYQVYISVMDNDFNKLWSKKVKLPYSQRQVATNSWVVSDSGEVHFLAKVYDDNKRRESKSAGKKAGYDMKLYKIADNGEKNKYDLKLNDAFIKGMKIELQEGSDEITLVGFTGDSRRGPIQGVSYMRLDENGETSFAKKRNFTNKELDSFGKKNTSKDRKSKEKGLDDEFVFQELIVDDNGNTTAVAEEDYYRISTSVDANGASRTKTTFFNRSIVVMDINSEGKVSNVGLIPKKQRQSKDGYPAKNKKFEPVTDFMYYTSVRTSKGVYFLYNDDEDNFKNDVINPDRYKRLSSARDAVAVLSHFDDSGKLIRKELFNKKDAKTLLMPKHCSQINDNQLFFFNKKAKLFGKNDFRFGVMTIND